MSVNRILAAQDGIITRRQAFAAGMSRSAISRRVTSQEWSRIAPCVYRRSDRGMTAHAELRVAVYSAGDRAVAFGPSAAWWHGLRAAPEQTWVTIPVRSAPEFRPGRRIRRLDLRSPDVTSIDGLPLTTLALTVLDTAVIDGPELLHRVLQADKVSMSELVDCHRRNTRRPCAERAGRLLAEVAQESHAAAVRRLIGILRHRRVTGWTTNARVFGQVFDVVFAVERVAVVADGWAAPGESGARELAAGWQVVRCPWREPPDRVLARIRTALATASETGSRA